MKLEMKGQMRLEQTMKLAPRMIQSMEILQLPILALQERIEQELNNNPVLEKDEIYNPEESGAERNYPDGEVSSEDLPQQQLQRTDEDLRRLDSLDENYKDYVDQSWSYRPASRSDEPDKKLEAMKNTAAPEQSLHDYLTEQWQMIDADEPVKKAGELIIDYIDEKGYLSVPLEQLHTQKTDAFSIDDLNKALGLVQKLEPAGVGARDLKECLLIQMAQSPDDMSFEKRLVSNYMKELLENRLPDIAKKMNCSIETVKIAIERMSKFDISPGLQIGQAQNHPITADVIAEPAEKDGDFSVRLADSGLPALRINEYYAKMAGDKSVEEKTKNFLKNNIRSAQWIIEAIEQRKNTLLKVAKTVVKYQIDFFRNGQLYLKPLPMSKIAEEVGVHVATVSRAVAGKYIQTPWGILPLRKFFSGGVEDDTGNEISWEAVRGKLQDIIDSEDKKKPLSDDQIRKKLADVGIKNLARRTVAKYRKILNIPAARFRKKY